MVIERKPEPGRHDADDGERNTAKVERAADDVRIASKACLPCLMADHDDRRRLFALVSRQQVPAHERRGARYGEPRRGDLRNRDGFIGGKSGREIVLSRAERAQLFHRLDLIPPLDEIAEHPALGAPRGRRCVKQGNNPLPLVERKSGVEYLVEDVEERRADRDGDGHRESADECQPAVLDQHADTEAGIERHDVEPAQPSRVAALLFVLLDPAERGVRLPPRFPGMEPALADEPLGLHVDVEAHLFLHRGVELFPAPQCQPQCAHPRPDGSHSASPNQSRRSMTAALLICQGERPSARSLFVVCECWDSCCEPHSSSVSNEEDRAGAFRWRRIRYVVDAKIAVWLERNAGQGRVAFDEGARSLADQRREDALVGVLPDAVASRQK